MMYEELRLIGNHCSCIRDEIISIMGDKNWHWARELAIKLCIIDPRRRYQTCVRKVTNILCELNKADMVWRDNLRDNAHDTRGAVYLWRLK